jgi:predicted MPP superfamily phosphohydrolase
MPLNFKMSHYPQTPSLTADSPRVTVRDGLKGVALSVTGVDSPWGGYADFDRALSMGDRRARSITLCHPQDLLPAMVVERQIDLILTGGYHGGQVRLQFLGMAISRAHLISELVERLYIKSQSQPYVNCNIGITGPPVRLMPRPEITLLHLV